MNEFKGRPLGAVTLQEFLAAIDGPLLLKPIRFQIRDRPSGRLTTYYIDRDRSPGEFPFPEKAQ